MKEIEKKRKVPAYLEVFKRVDQFIPGRADLGDLGQAAPHDVEAHPATRLHFRSLEADSPTPRANLSH